jgi:hypothetical protein
MRDSRNQQVISTQINPHKAQRPLKKQRAREAIRLARRVLRPYA